MNRPRLVIALAAGALVLVFGAGLARPLSRQLKNISVTTAHAAGTCGLSQVAFCDTFDAPAGRGDRAGDLNGVVWGVSRTSSSNNSLAGAYNTWVPSHMQGCGNPVVLPEADHKICNGQLFESFNDDGQVVYTAAYPKQPFDWAGRTGTVAFDVDLSLSGPHGVWPTFAITDKPTPVPSADSAAEAAYAQSQLGFSLAQTCAAGQCGACATPASGMSVDIISVVTNYRYSAVPFTVDNCVVARPGTPNHFQVKVSSSSIVVLGTDPGGSVFRQIAHTGAISVPFTRGLIWIGHAAYNAAKFGQPADADHTFVWDNVGFDGPVLARDLGYDVPDASSTALGYGVSNTAPTTWTVTGVADPATAAKALLTLSYQPYAATGFNYRVNNGAWQNAGWPFDGTTFVWRTIALPVPLTDIHAGTNTIQVQGTDSSTWTFANIDLILVGAGGTGGIPTSPAPTATVSPTPSPTPLPTTSPTPSPSASPTPGPTSTPSTPSFRASATDGASSLPVGGTQAITATVTSMTPANALVDVEVHNAGGTMAMRQTWDNQGFSAGQSRNFNVSWTIPAGTSPGMYTVAVGVYGPGGAPMYTMNGSAAQFAITTATPTPAPALLGDKAVEASADSDATGQAEAFQYSASSSGNVTKLALYLGGQSTASRVIVGLYSNSASGHPGALLTQGTISSPLAGAWNTVSVPAAAVTAGQKYWLAVLTPAGASGTLQFVDQASGGVSESSSQTTLTSLPAAWSAGTRWPTGNMSAYAAP